jgi:hypothetical protein
MVWVPLAVAVLGTAVAGLMSLADHRRKKGDHPSHRAAREGVLSLMPRTEHDVDARERLPHLKMRNGDYELDEVRLTLRQSDF